MNAWIKRSDREPTKVETPVMYGRYKGEEWLETSAQYGWPASLNIEYNYWRSIKADPPPRELTQRERDATLARNIAMGHEGTVTECVLEGIYAERREVAKLMDEIMRNSTWGTSNAWEPYHRQLRARLDEQGAK